VSLPQGATILEVLGYGAIAKLAISDALCVPPIGAFAQFHDDHWVFARMRSRFGKEINLNADIVPPVHPAATNRRVLTVNLRRKAEEIADEFVR
jgi:hypothetical protein